MSSSASKIIAIRPTKPHPWDLEEESTRRSDPLERYLDGLPWEWAWRQGDRRYTLHDRRGDGRARCGRTVRWKGGRPENACHEKNICRSCWASAIYRSELEAPWRWTKFYESFQNRILRP